MDENAKAPQLMDTHTPNKFQSNTKSDIHSKKLVEVEQIAEDLEEKHGGHFTCE